MTVTLNIKVHAEHAAELAKDMPKNFAHYKTFIEQQHAEGAFGDPARVRLRFMLDCENFMSPEHIAAEQGAHTPNEGDADAAQPHQSTHTTEGESV